MATKTQFSEQDIITMLSRYSIGEVVTSSPISSGTVQTLYAIETSTGKYILKVYENRSFESVQFEAGVVTYIYKKGFPCANAIGDKRNQVVNTVADKPFVIFDFIKGSQPDSLNQQQRQQVIQTAAQLQSITKRYRPRYQEFRWNYTPDLVRKLVNESAHKLDTATAYAKLRWFEETLLSLDLPQNLPKGICHCDFDLSNVLFDGDKLVALLDFDDANYTYLTSDLVHLIDLGAWRFGEDFNPAAARQVASEYHSARPLSPIEKRHVFDVHKLQILIDGIWFFGRGSADDFYEKQKIEFLDSMGRDGYYDVLFGDR